MQGGGWGHPRSLRDASAVRPLCYHPIHSALPLLYPRRSIRPTRASRPQRCARERPALPPAAPGVPPAAPTSLHPRDSAPPYGFRSALAEGAQHQRPACLDTLTRSDAPSPCATSAQRAGPQGTPSSTSPVFAAGLSPAGQRLVRLPAMNHFGSSTNCGGMWKQYERAGRGRSRPNTRPALPMAGDRAAASGAASIHSQHAPDRNLK